MEIFDREKLVGQVLRNCDISDASGAGLFSLCGLALRLRDLYKWEKRLDPWVEKDSGEILEWIGHKEEHWEELAGQDYAKLSFNGRRIDPFDTDAVNEILIPEGLLYGAGYARGLKATFFLAEIREIRKAAGRDVFILGRELARDMLTLPALSQDESVFVRMESARMYFWDQVFYMKKSGAPFFRFALKKCGIDASDPESLRKNLDSLLERYQDAYIYHEVGEITDTDFGRDPWREIIAAYPQTIVEFFARTVKDLLADLNGSGTLRHMIRKQDDIAVALYAAFFDGLARSMFPELRIGVEKFLKTGDWREMETAVDSGYAMAKRNKDVIVRLCREGEKRRDNKWVEEKMQAHIDSQAWAEVSESTET